MFPVGILLTVIGVYYLSRREISSRRRGSTMASLDDDLKLLNASQNEEEVCRYSAALSIQFLLSIHCVYVQAGILTRDIDITCTSFFLGVDLFKTKVNGMALIEDQHAVSMRTHAVCTCVCSL